LRSPSVGKHEGLRRAVGAASFVFVAGLSIQKRPAGRASPNWTKAASWYERRKNDLKTAKESNVASYLKLGFKLIGEWDVIKDDRKHHNPP
jgi:hypothetical protein